MRVSVHEEDPGYRHDASYAYKVLLDGCDVTANCYTADEEEGMVYRYAVNAEGEKFVNPNTEMPAVEVLQGEVEIIVLKNGARYSAKPC
jgi:hypothetical protein